MAEPLTPQGVRTDLTDRECTRIIGGVLGSLAGMADSLETLRNAVRWWADNDDAWEMMRKQEETMRWAGLSPKR